MLQSSSFASSLLLGLCHSSPLQNVDMTHTDQLEAVVTNARSELNVLSGIMAQRKVRAKVPAPFACVEDSASAQAILDAHDTFIFDCDGVLWSGGLGLLPGAAETLAELARRGKRLIFVTNNSARSREAYARKFAGLGLTSITADQIVPASFVAARWLRSAKPEIERAFVIGEDGVEEELRAAGIEVVRAEVDGFSEAAFTAAEPDPRIGAVVVGADSAFSFNALAQASLCLERLPGCLFIATNADEYDVVGGRRLPGAGCLVAAVQCACGRAPDAICGKPSADLARYLLDVSAPEPLDPARTLVVGDRMDTDVALARTMGASSLLVLSGVARASEVAKMRAEQPGCPKAVASHLGALLEPQTG